MRPQFTTCLPITSYDIWMQALILIMHTNANDAIPERYWQINYNNWLKFLNQSEKKLLNG